jgi:excisionase family DNA binding protein
MPRVAADHVSLDQAAHILAMSKRTLVELMDSGELPTVRGPGRQGRLLRADVEAHAVALRARRYRAPDSYFVTTAGVAELLGTSRPRVIQLGDKGFLPYLITRNGWRLYRRHQIKVIANSRTARASGRARKPARRAGQGCLGR